MTDPREILKGIQPGQSLEVLPGLTFTRLKKSGFMRARVHYTVLHERRDPAWARASAARYGVRGVKSYKWRREQEIDYTASSSEPVYANWDAAVHLIDPFPIPRHWPRWLMYDVGGVNPHALMWVTVEPKAPYPFYVYREWYKGVEMPDGSPMPYFVAEDVIRIAYEQSVDDLGAPEHLRVLLVDPAARKGEATRGEKVSVRGATVYEQIVDMVENLGWNVDVMTGNNLKDRAIEDLIDALGNYPLYSFDGEGSVEIDEKGEPVVMQDLSGAPMIVAPRLFVFRTCVWTAFEMPLYRWKDWSTDRAAEGANRPEEPVDKDDHQVTNLIRFMNLLRSDPELAAYGTPEAAVTADASSKVVRLWRKRLGNRYRGAQ